MFVVYADRHAPQREEAAPREGFTAEAFSHALAQDRQSGTITLQPQAHILTVGAGAEDYERIRIFGENGALIGAMTCSPYGSVHWSTPMWT
jgi:hypothetical protein